jgi:hypothetical protein
MWSQEGREAFALFMAFVEAKVTELFEVIAEFISTYRSYILIGLIILIGLVILRLVRNRQEKQAKQKINARIDVQMKQKMIDDDSDTGP